METSTLYQIGKVSCATVSIYPAIFKWQDAIDTMSRSDA